MLDLCGGGRARYAEDGKRIPKSSTGGEGKRLEEGNRGKKERDAREKEQKTACTYCLKLKLPWVFLDSVAKLRCTTEGTRVSRCSKRVLLDHAAI
jgi:hypothetical protein